MSQKKRKKEETVGRLFLSEPEACLDDPLGPECFPGFPEDALWPFDALYLEAHRWLPPDWFFEGTPSQMETVRQAAACLDSPSDDDDRLLWALAVLGHSPCSAAIERLGRYAGSFRPYASVAHSALLECLEMAEEIGGIATSPYLH